MERLTGKQAQNMMEALASVYDVINEMDERSPEANAAKQEAAKLAAQKRRESQNVKQDAADSGAGGKTQQPAASAPVKKSDRPAEKKRTPITAGGGAPEEDGQVDRYRRAAQERARKNRGNMSEGITSVVNSPQDKAKGPAPTPGRSKTKMGPGKGGKRPTKVGLPMKREDVDVFDIVKGHLIDEGLTEEEALKKMLTLTDEERTEIIEGSCGSMKKKKKSKKGGY